MNHGSTLVGLWTTHVLEGVAVQLRGRTEGRNSATGRLPVGVEKVRFSSTVGNMKVALPEKIALLLHPHVDIRYSLLLYGKLRRRDDIMRGITNFDTRQFDSSNNEFCGLRLMVRVDVLGSVNPNTNPNLNPNPNQKPLA